MKKLPTKVTRKKLDKDGMKILAGKVKDTDTATGQRINKVSKKLFSLVVREDGDADFHFYRDYDRLSTIKTLASIVNKLQIVDYKYKEPVKKHEVKSSFGRKLIKHLK